MELGLKGRVAVVTGGSEGIGKAAGLSLAAEGATVVICGRREDALARAASEIRAAGGQVLAVQADVTRTEDIDRLFDRVIDQFKRVDILVNNAGVSNAGPLESKSDAEWQADLDLKLFAAIRCSRRAIPLMRRDRWGRIVNVTSIGGRTPGAGSVPTSVSRAAGIALTKAMSRELAKDNILVNTVCIGLVKSGQHERAWQERRRDEPSLGLEDFYRSMARVDGVPLGRVGEAGEAGDVIAFLASERASYLTGTAINIDGGESPVV
ncbi:MAG: SDR family oxidoreductase [SAR202 cluster bacterium]|nr:SDR family oxidoreductase [SAR202 cluster bacterium]